MVQVKEMGLERDLTMSAAAARASASVTGGAHGDGDDNRESGYARRCLEWMREMRRTAEARQMPAVVKWVAAAVEADRESEGKSQGEEEEGTGWVLCVSTCECRGGLLGIICHLIRPYSSVRL